MKALILIPVVVAAAAAGFLAGRASTDGDASAAASAAVAKAGVERDEALAELQKVRTQLATERRQRAEAATVRTPDAGGITQPPRQDGDLVPSGTGSDPAGETAPAPLNLTDRERDVRDLRARIEPAFTDGDGESALEVLRKLATIVPEGRAAAMELAVRINEDVNGDGKLRLDQYGFYTSLGDTGVRDLMLWSMENESPADFRVLAAYSVPWVVQKDRAIEVLGKSLATEKDVMVQQAVVVNLAQMNHGQAEKLLASVLADVKRDSGIRAQIATTLATTSNPELALALETAANADPDDRVRAAARASLIARNPPQDGFLVTIVIPEGAAATAGVAPGDILVSYDGKPVRDLKEIRAAIDAATAESVALVVLRQGNETALRIGRGRLGIQGRAVRRK